ncbi:MAG: DUF2752 domain-containing protein [Bacteroidales bacterium]|nr:DUF2752 domain-containing protein [Bacteroidales bacterium]
MKLSSSRRAYFAVNAIFAGVILLIMGYSAFYSPDTGQYPVPCIHEKLTGEPCPSCGLSHAFSLIVRGRIAEALEWNSTSLRVFVFFALQLVMRAGLGVWTLLAGRGSVQAAGPEQVSVLRQVTVTDAVVSSAMALVAFYPFLRALWISHF